MLQIFTESLPVNEVEGSVVVWIDMGKADEPEFVPPAEHAGGVCVFLGEDWEPSQRVNLTGSPCPHTSMGLSNVSERHMPTVDPHTSDPVLLLRPKMYKLQVTDQQVFCKPNSGDAA